MAKEQFLSDLFDAHAKDLKELYREDEDIFVCPICLTAFPRDAIREKIVTDGHVWPKSIRMSSEKAKEMHVLLCADCNHGAGGHGDVQMQLHEKIRWAEKTGELGRRKIQLTRRKDNSPINLNVDVTYHPEDKNLTISGRVDGNARWRDGSQEDQRKFLEIYHNREPVKMVIHPPKNYRPELAQAGWITSAYLMGFYCLGYRFVFDSSLDPVREYILNSFDKTIKQNPVQLNPDDFGIWEQQSIHSADPELLFMIPFELGKHVYLQTNYLKYEIRLPFRYIPSVLLPTLYQVIPNFDKRLLELREAKETFFFRVPDNKINSRRSWYDLLLGAPQIKREPDPEASSNQRS